MIPPPVIWIAWAPAGTWSSGPAVVSDPDMAEQYRGMGWTVEGPYIYNGAPVNPEPEYP